MIDSDPNKEKLLSNTFEKKSESSQISVKDCIKKLSLKQQIRLLITKNLRIFQRNLGFIWYHLTILIMIFLWMLLISYLIKNQSSLVHTESFPATSLDTFQKCGDSPIDKTTNCLSLGVVLIDENPLNPHTEDWIEKAIYDVENKYNLIDEKDVKIIYRGKSMEDLYDIMQDYSEIRSMVTFCNQMNVFKNDTLTVACNSVNYSGFEIDVNVYGIHYNSTRLTPNYLRDTGTPIESDNNAILLKMSIDESIINYYREHSINDDYFSLPFNPNKTCRKTNSVKPQNKYKSVSFLGRTEATEEIPEQIEASNGNSFEYDLRIMDYPKPVNRFIQKFDSSNQWGSFYYMFMILLSFVKFSQLIAKEKQYQLRKGLIPLGLNHFAYWFSWLVCILIFDIIFALLIVLGGLALGFPIFREVVFVMPLIVILLCLWSYRFLSVLVITFCDNYRSATKANYTILVISIFLQSNYFYFFSNN